MAAVVDWSRQFFRRPPAENLRRDPSKRAGFISVEKMTVFPG